MEADGLSRHTVPDIEPEWKRQRRSQAKRASTDPKQKTQPDGDEELCQYGLCCDAWRLLWCRDGGDAKLFKERWEKKDRKGNIGYEVQKLDPEICVQAFPNLVTSKPH